MVPRNSRHADQPTKPRGAWVLCTHFCLLPSTIKRLAKYTGRVNPFRTAVPFWGQTSQISSSLSPKRDCGSKRQITTPLVNYYCQLPDHNTCASAQPYIFSTKNIVALWSSA